MIEEEKLEMHEDATDLRRPRLVRKQRSREEQEQRWCGRRASLLNASSMLNLSLSSSSRQSDRSVAEKRPELCQWQSTLCSEGAHTVPKSDLELEANCAEQMSTKNEVGSQLLLLEFIVRRDARCACVSLGRLGVAGSLFGAALDGARRTSQRDKQGPI